MIHGLLPVYKTKNITSHTVVERVRRILGIRKVGHFGTLDPFAEGLLLIATGYTTKFFNFYIKKKKTYTGMIRFGYATKTYDVEGEPLGPKRDVDLNAIDIHRVLKSFVGKIPQKPPIYSAKKFKGKPLYKYARENMELEIKPIMVEIFQLEGEIVDPETLKFETKTSSGTYIRSLAHDIGEKVGVGAYLHELKRERIGEFDLKGAISSDRLEGDASVDEVMSRLLPIEVLLPEFSKIIVNQAGRRAVVNGMPLQWKEVIKVESTEDTSHFRLFDEEGKLLAISRKEENTTQFKPVIVFPNDTF